MPPKKKEITLDDIASMIGGLQSEIKEINKKLDSVVSSNKKLEDSVNILTEQLKMQILISNKHEQHNRVECLRITNLPLDPDQASDNVYVKQAVYDGVLKPILQAACDDPRDNLKQLPSKNELVKNAHILPKPRNKQNDPNPIIVRLNQIDVRSRIFKYRGKYTSPISGVRPMVKEDLTKLNITTLSRLHSDEKIDTAWSMQGNLFYTLKSESSSKKHRVTDPFDWLTKDDLSSLGICLPESSVDDQHSNQDESV